MPHSIYYATSDLAHHLLDKMVFLSMKRSGIHRFCRHVQELLVGVGRILCTRFRNQSRAALAQVFSFLFEIWMYIILFSA